MMKNFTVVVFMAIFGSLSALSARAQDRVIIGDKCPGKIHSSRDVTRRARIIQEPNLKIVAGHDVHGTVVIEAVLCRTGRVTDIRVVQGLPFGITESAIDAVSNIRFEPAEMNLHSVSQGMRFEFSINDNAIKEIAPADAAGRLVERLEIVGNRRSTVEQIRSWIKTQPGEPYNSDQAKRDLNTILATGYFDKTATRVYTEEGARGGVGVIFRVVELSLIIAVKFEGLKIDQSVVLKALEKEQINLRTGVPFQVEQMKNALRVIKQVLESNGQGFSKVDLQIEHVTAMTINVIFVITNNNE